MKIFVKLLSRKNSIQHYLDYIQGYKEDCPSGRLTLDLFIDIYMSYFPSEGNPEDFLAHVFRTFDSDNSGTIDFKEFLMIIDVTTEGTDEEKWQWAFR